MTRRDMDKMPHENSVGGDQPLNDEQAFCSPIAVDTELPERFKQGMIVISLKGHDRGRLYLVLAQKGETRLLLADGRTRGYVDAKLKNKKHVRPLGQLIEEKELDELIGGEMCERECDTFIRKLISGWALEKGIATR